MIESPKTCSTKGSHNKVDPTDNFRTNPNSDDSTFISIPSLDPLLVPPPSTVREGDHVLLLFADGRQCFAHCVSTWKGKTPPLKISKRGYPTANLIGLPYGTVLELDRGGLVPLSEEEDLLPDISEYLQQQTTSTRNGNTSMIPYSSTTISTSIGDPVSSEEDNGNNLTITQERSLLMSSFTKITTTMDYDKDNRHLIDSNNAQSITQAQLMKMKHSGQYSGSTIVQCLIENSSTFTEKTDFSKVKYWTRKTKKHQPRCRLTRCTASTICTAMYLKNPRLVLNLREDSLGQMMSYANVYAGAQILLMESCCGIITGAVAQRMGGYGKLFSIYTSQQPAWQDMLKKFNLTFAEHQSIKWIHSGEIFGSTTAEPLIGRTSCISNYAHPASGDDKDSPMVLNNNDSHNTNKKCSETRIDTELQERQNLNWPCPLQDHTRKHLGSMSSSEDQVDFLSKRCSRFARKLTRHTAIEASQMLMSSPCDSILIATKYDPTETLFSLIPYLAPSCPFVVFCEHMEPLVECFSKIQKQQNLAINLRLTDTWLREYQILPGRSHPNMNMSQCGGYILSGIKLCPLTGHNNSDQDVFREVRAQVGGRRGKKKKKTTNSAKEGSNVCNGKSDSGTSSKRARLG